MDENLKRIKAIADYQFGRGCGVKLFPEGVKVIRSKNTGRIRHVYHEGTLIANFRPTVGLFTLTTAGAERLVSKTDGLGFTVTVSDEVAEFVIQGRNVFAKHVVDAADEIRPGDEVVVLDSDRRVLAVGRALLNKEEMLAFEVGVAVKVRRGSKEH
jgi:predicted RNA-binding protein (TIGR00451 family)